MTPPGDRPRIGFVLERSLGHTTHAATLARLIHEQPGVDARVAQIDYDASGLAAKIPIFNSNWTVRAGVRARRLVRGWTRSGGLDGLFVHTQVPAVLMPDHLRRIPTVVSLDATPLQFDALGRAYAHSVGHPRIEHLKWRANQVCFERAVHVVAWSEWARRGVVDGYGIAPSKVTVIPPGVTPALWRRPAGAADARDGVVHILFVGGDLERKGGRDVIAAVRRLRHEGHDGTGGTEVVLDLVTRADVRDEPGIRVHRGTQPNSPALVALFHRADVFALPTTADTLGIALVEAGAAGLPLVATTMAGLSEMVIDGQTGLAVQVGDAEGLHASLRRLVDDEPLRRRLGDGAAARAAERFDAGTNTATLIELVTSATQRGRGRPPS